MLEASAGTGKTHTIAGLACRYLAEGVARIDELMLVTFGRAATAELRERVRERLSEVTAALADTGPPAPPVTTWCATWRGAPTPRSRERHRLLDTAVADFDAATIATTHGFCHQMLAGLGIAADLDHDVTFAETTHDLIADVAVDLYVADYGRADSDDPRVDFATASAVAATAVGDPSARLTPQDADPGQRGRGARAVRATRARGGRPAQARDAGDGLRRPAGLPARRARRPRDRARTLRNRIRSRYKIVLVDEFQDTDPVQWDILERTFHGHRTLVLIGDPKQAIYAFRGADVVTYLAAKRVGGRGGHPRDELAQRPPARRGAAPPARGRGARRPEIRVREVAPQHPDASLLGAPVSAPVRLRRVPRRLFGVDNGKRIPVDAARSFVARDVAADVVRLLASGAEIVERDGRPAPARGRRHRGPRAPQPRRRPVRDALAALDVPVVLTASPRSSAHGGPTSG